MLPWYVNGTLTPDDAARVEAHLASCASCASDARAQARLRSLLRAPAPVEYAPSAGLRKLLTRIEEVEREYPESGAEIPRDRASRRTGSRAVRWLVAAVVVQAVGLAAIGASQLWPPQGGESSPTYRTLTSSATTAHDAQRFRVVFEQTMTLAELGDLLRVHRLTIVAGPSESGILTLALPEPDPALESSVLASLRADAHVRFAEPVAPGTASQ